LRAVCCERVPNTAAGTAPTTTPTIAPAADHTSSKVKVIGLLVARQNMMPTSARKPRATTAVGQDRRWFIAPLSSRGP
jgi:hypothetical protein